MSCNDDYLSFFRSPFSGIRINHRSSSHISFGHVRCSLNMTTFIVVLMVKLKITHNMKSRILMIGVVTLLSFVAKSQHTETRPLDDFDAIDFDGNARIYFEQGTSHSIIIEAKREHHLREFNSDVRNGTLYLGFEDDRENKRKLRLTITHTGINEMDLDGFVNLISRDPIISEELEIKADGFIKGDLEVEVEDLYIDADGFVYLGVYGKADRVDFQLDGFGNIDAKDLEVKKSRKDANGFAWISF